MTTGEELAICAFPPIIVGEGKTRYDANELPRGIFLQGYELGRMGRITWLDVQMIDKVTEEVEDELDEDAFYKAYPTEKEFYEEVMRRVIRRILKQK